MAGYFFCRKHKHLNSKLQAQRAVQLEISSGRMQRAHSYSCVDCGKPANTYDHRDYNKPLAVDPVCQGCNLRRGPAIPRPGVFHAMVDAGIVPYVLRRRVEMLFETMGLPLDPLGSLPRRLNLDHWRALLQFFPSN